MAMRVTECGILIAPGEQAWVSAWRQRVALPEQRVRLYDIALEQALMALDGLGSPWNANAGAALLGRLEPALRRFDLCLLPIRPATLCWSRIALAWRQRGQPDVPMVGLLDDLQAPAVLDLVRLGLNDFIPLGAGEDEICVRLRRAAIQGARADAWPAEAAQPASAGMALSARPLLSLCEIDHARTSFQEAKRLVMGTFEREYVDEALAQAGGNVAAAARAVNKHRRAFWSLMRKHGVDAQRYREMALRQGRDGTGKMKPS